MSRLPELTRLVRLLTRKHQPPMSLARIAGELQCAERSVKRYIRDLRDTFGYPIEFDREAEGYRFVPGKDGEPGLELPGLFFSESELSALLTMRELLATVRPGLFDKDLAPLGRRVEKLIAETGVEASEVAKRIRIVSIGTRVATDIVFRSCADAALSRRRLRLSYKARGREGDWEEREISPQRLVRYRDNWYLDAWCHTRKALRVMALDQMRDTRILDTPAKDVPDAELDQVLKSSYGIFSGEPTGTAVLRFTPHRAQWVAKEDWHPEQKSRWLEDGSYELTIPYGRPEELLMDVLRHGAEVEVIEPPELRDRLAGIVREMGARYSRETA
jgi:proteasome accessory factor C